MATATCVMNPMTPVSCSTACTTAQTGDPAKDAPYYPPLAPNGNFRRFRDASRALLLIALLPAASASAQEATSDPPLPPRRQRARRRSGAAARRGAGAARSARRPSCARCAPSSTRRSTSTPPSASAASAVTLFGFVQADGVVYSSASVDEVNPSTGAPLNETRFLIRRARLRVDADYGYFAGVARARRQHRQRARRRASPTSRSRRCWPRCERRRAPPLVMGTLGLTRIPFGFEVQEKDYVRLFLERSNVARALFPGEYDLGARAAGRLALAALAGGGDERPSVGRQAVRAASIRRRRRIFSGRVGVDTRPPARASAFAGGVSALYGTGFSRGTASTKDTLVWRDANGDGQVDITEIIGVVGQPAHAVANVLRATRSAAICASAVELPRVGPLTVYGEISGRRTSTARSTSPIRSRPGAICASSAGTSRSTQQLDALVRRRRALRSLRSRRRRAPAGRRATSCRATRRFSTLTRGRGGDGAAVRAAVVRVGPQHQRARRVDVDAAPATTLGGDVLTLRGQVVF